jgi:hypothetical protein
MPAAQCRKSVRRADLGPSESKAKRPASAYGPATNASSYLARETRSRPQLSRTSRLNVSRNVWPVEFCGPRPKRWISDLGIAYATVGDLLARWQHTVARAGARPRRTAVPISAEIVPRDFAPPLLLGKVQRRLPQQLNQLHTGIPVGSLLRHNSQ